jgi:hypothetical protein
MASAAAVRRFGSPVVPQTMMPVARPKPPPAVPDGWEARAPDFVGVGAGRCGTSWWWELIAQHPEFARVNRYKEVHFFDHYLGVEEVEAAAYHRYFPRPPGMFTGEWTPLYMYDFWTPPMLRRTAPDTKILVMLRDPLERYLSGLAFAQARGFEISHSVMHYQYQRSLYGQQVRTVLAHFPVEQVLILQYERCVSEPTRLLRRTLEFIGADPQRWRPSRSAAKRVNESRTAKPELTAATREALRVALRADLVSLFQAVPDLDADLWPTARGMTA